MMSPWKTLLVVTAILLVVDKINAQACLSPQTQDPFDAWSYMGTWYEISKTTIPPYEIGLKCISALYSDAAYSDNGAASFTIQNCGRTEVNATTTCSNGVANSTLETNPDGTITVLQGKFDARIGAAPRPGPYWVLRFDATYAIVYSCSISPNTGAKSEVAWILARAPFFRMDNRYPQALDYAESVGIPRESWITTQQYGCNWEGNSQSK